MSRNFGEIFELELRCWCSGLERVSETIDSNVLHQVIKEFAPVLREAVENYYVCDITDTAIKLIASSRCRVSEKEIVFSILAHLPLPAEINEPQAVVLNKIVAQVEIKHTGATKRLEKKWNSAPAQNWKTNAETPSFANLSFPPKLV